MNQTETLDRVRMAAADVLGADVASLHAGSSPDDLESWDSVQHLNLVMALEEQFGVQFEPEEIEKMKTLGAIAGILAARA